MRPKNEGLNASHGSSHPGGARPDGSPRPPDPWVIRTWVRRCARRASCRSPLSWSSRHRRYEPVGQQATDLWPAASCRSSQLRQRCGVCAISRDGATHFGNSLAKLCSWWAPHRRWVNSACLSLIPPHRLIGCTGANLSLEGKSVSACEWEGDGFELCARCVMGGIVKK